MPSVRRSLAGLAVLVLLMAACRGSEEPEGNTGPGDGEIATVNIGYSNSLSGDFAAYGTPMLEGTELAVAEVNARAEENGFEINLVIRDDRTDPEEGTVIAQAFCDDSDLQAVLGFNWSTLLLAAMPIYDQCGMPVIAQGTTSPELSGLSPYFHRSVESDALTGRRIVEYAVNEVGATNIAIFNPNDDYGVGVSEVALQAAEDLGATVVLREQYAVGTKDFRASVTNLRDADAEAVLLLGFFSDSAKIVEQSREVGVDATFVASQSMRSQDFLDLAGEAAEGTFVASDFEPAASPAAQEFFDNFSAEYGHPPDSITSVSYDAVLILEDALKRADGDYTREGINNALKEVSVEGLWQTLELDENGDPARELLWLEVRDGEFVAVQ